MRPAPCEVTGLPLGALEAFVLSQVDGQSTLEEIASIAGLELAAATRLAERLVELGAVRTPGKDRKTKAPPSMRPRRGDPRAEPVSEAPRPPTQRPSIRPPTRKSIRVSTAAPSRPVVEVCELDDATQATILALEAKLSGSDLYVALGIERDAVRKAAKNAYFALASKYHPDRFFKKKLGPMRASIERIFHRLTEAHDVLTDAARREQYDKTLPPAPTPARVSKAPPSSGRASQAPRSSSRPSKAPPASGKVSARPSKVPPASMKVSARPSKLAPASPPISARVADISVVSVQPSSRAPVIMPSRAPPSLKPSMRPASRSIAPEIQRRIDVFVQAAEDALRKNDVIAAANNYRLALQNSNDPILRSKLEMVDDMAKLRRFELSLPRGRAAERDGKWVDAAFEYGRAHEARPTAETAERTANALRLSGGDLDRALALAEYAVARVTQDVGYRVTLGEILFALRNLDRAIEECDRVIAVAPNEARAKQLAASLKKARK